MRVDLYLTAEGYFPSRSLAQAEIAKGNVYVDGNPVKRASAQIEDGPHTVEVRDPMPYVSRGGLKLAGALDTFGLDVSGLRALDIGASTGGFTDVLLQRGAAHVTALDSGSDQLHPRLRADSRVLCLEHCNARALSSAPILPPYDLAVMDVSFISQTYILPGLSDALAADGYAVTLIKPQFEAGRAAIGRGGIVRREADRMAAILRVLESASACRLLCLGLMRSPIDGGDGNHEFLVCLKKTQECPPSPDSSTVRRMLGGSTL